MRTRSDSKTKPGAEPPVAARPDMAHAGLVNEVVKSEGDPLPASARSLYEPQFRQDFSRVRVHTDAHAADSAASLGARAWTLGDHIGFSRDSFQPGSPGGSALLAHELTHVAQQQKSGLSASPRLGEPGDRWEREADSQTAALAAGAASASVTPVDGPVVQRSLLSGFLDVLLFIPRLFGLDFFPAEQLREYLQGLKDRKGPEKSLFADNKARACVSREKELGPYDTQTKIWLIQDMLEGWTASGDESAINALLRRSNDRAAIVAGVGRDRLWSNFSGGNKRILEALTLTAAEAGDVLVSRLRRLETDEIQDYVSNAIDPAVKAAAQKALALARITAPVPVNAAVTAAGEAQLTINGVDVVVRPDQINPAVGKHAFTHAEYNFTDYAPLEITPENENVPVAPVPPSRITVTIWTEFASEAQKRETSGYGVGTRPEDTKTLQTHERAHGQAWFDFLRDNAPPAFNVPANTLPAQFNAIVTQYKTDVQAYMERAQRYALKAGDCVGTLPTNEQLEGTGYTAAICREAP